MLGGDVGVAQLPGVGIRAVEDAVELATERRLRRPALLRRKASELPLDRFGESRNIEPGLLQQRLHHSFGLGKQGRQQVGVVHHGIAATAGLFAGLAEGLLGLDGQSFGSDHRYPRGTVVRARFANDRAGGKPRSPQICRYGSNLGH